MRTCLLLLALLLGGAAGAHDADIIYAQVTHPGGGEVRERLTLTASTLALMAPVDANGDRRVDDAELQAGRAAIEAGVWQQIPLTAGEKPCRRLATRAELFDTYVALEGSFACAEGPLAQEFRVLGILPGGYRIVLGSYGRGGEFESQRFAQGSQQRLLIFDPGPGTASPTAPSLGGWFNLGVQHIFGGIDHLAFLLALLLVGGTWRRVLVLATSFTVAHSITLGLTALGVLRLEPSLSRWVEVAIALSIVWVALENLILREHRHRVWLTFTFGLVHGFGFAQVLMELGLRDHAAVALAGFNLGVEAGQAAIIGVAFPVVRILQRRPMANLWMLRLGSGAILAAGAFWVVTRIGG